MSGLDPAAARPLPADLRDWLDRSAASLDADAALAAEVVPRLGAAGLFGRGVPLALGGGGGDVRDGVAAIAAVAERSLAAAFVCWAQRAFIEYLLQSPNAALRARSLPGLLAGHTAGATGLSNAMKFLCGLEGLGLRSTRARGGWTLHGAVPWATNLRPQGFSVALAIAPSDGGAPWVVALPHERPGLERSCDLDLIALRGSNTAALRLDAVAIGEDALLAPDARDWLPRVRPAFLGLQCGLSIGLARASLAAARATLGPARAVLQGPLAAAQERLESAVAALADGLAGGRYVEQPAALFRLRIALAERVQDALQLELQAGGGRAYHRDQPLGFARRWAESAFIPIVTPSLTQLQGELLKQAGGTRVAA